MVVLQIVFRKLNGCATNVRGEAIRCTTGEAIRCTTERSEVALKIFLKRMQKNFKSCII